MLTLAVPLLLNILHVAYELLSHCTLLGVPKLESHSHSCTSRGTSAAQMQHQVTHSTLQHLAPNQQPESSTPSSHYQMIK